MKAPALFAVLVLSAAPLAAQNRRCQIQIDNVERQGMEVKVTPTASNYFAGGKVRLRCRGQDVRIWADSIASYQGAVVQFIGNFRYEDDAAKVTSDFGTYYRDDERWEAQGNVVYLDRRDGSQLKGPHVNYYRRVKGVRELEEAFAEQRPTLSLAARDSAGRPGEPYVLVADRVRTRGQDLMWAGGSVTIDRSDLRGRGDSIQLDNGKAGAGALIGHAAIRRTAEDSFALAGKRIDLALVKKELSAVTGRDSATLRSRDLDLNADAIRLRLEAKKVVQTLAWGKTRRPEALAEQYQVRGDSLAVDTPEESLKELRAFGKAWVGFRPDSAKGEQDWLSGEKIVAEFGVQSSVGQKKSALRRLEARESARSFYRIASGSAPGVRPSVNYSRADRILLTMQPGDSLKVERVEMMGHVDGVQLEPTVVVKADSTRPKKP
ncbi:MAG TPA: hypothetical protein VGQ73_02710 [Gemmatimonadales bacterium]|jgi:hypothetical protein|nr:hypothetical protein [Gemmatimonadales bacterium]